jgi:hypothetical protein
LRAAAATVQRGRSLAVGRRLGDLSCLAGGDRQVRGMVYFARCAHVVEAIKDGQIEYWAAATHRDDALTVVDSQTSPDWGLVVTEHCLSREQAAELKMMHNTVLKLETAPKIGRRARAQLSHPLVSTSVISRRRCFESFSNPGATPRMASITRSRCSGGIWSMTKRSPTTSRSAAVVGLPSPVAGSLAGRTVR